jgi:hypothetical protein
MPRFSGGGYAAVLLFPRKDVHIIKGTLRQYATQSMAGGSLDDPSQFRPAMDVQIADAQPWDLLDPATRKFDRYPAQ